MVNGSIYSPATVLLKVNGEAMRNNYTVRINWEYARNIDFLTFRFHETNIINPMQNTSSKEYYGFYTIKKKCVKNFYIY
jgi:hypothetical protein